MCMTFKNAGNMFSIFKGQLILKVLFGVFKSTKNQHFPNAYSFIVLEFLFLNLFYLIPYYLRRTYLSLKFIYGFKNLSFTISVRNFYQKMSWQRNSSRLTEIHLLGQKRWYIFGGWAKRFTHLHREFISFQLFILQKFLSQSSNV